MQVDPEGGILWKDSPLVRGMQDCFTHMKWDGHTLTANTWSCYRVAVDTQNGDVAVLEFTE
jgi:hypothetical protein